MTTPRTGSLGVLSATGNMLYRNAAGAIEEVDTASAADGQVLTRVLGVPAWAASTLAIRATMEANPNDAIYQAIGALALPTASLRDTFPIISYDPDTDQGVPFELVVPMSYDGGDLTVTIYWTSTAVVNDVTFDGSFERNEAGHNITASAFAAVKSVTDTAPAVDGDIEAATIAFTNGEADSIVAGNMFRFLLTRDADADTLLAAAQVLGITIIED
jgi:hypothetical protein